MNPPTILIVEEERIVSREIFLRLQSLGYEPIGRAVTGEQALEMAKKQRPDLVLMDIRLQGSMDGIAAAREFRSRFHVPVVFLTACSEDDTLEWAKLAEPYGYLLKPFDDRELKSAIEIALYKHQAEEELRRMNRLYDVLSQVNQTIVRVESREEVFTAVCRIMVERGGIDLAWIGCLDPASSRLGCVAKLGDRSELLKAAEFYADCEPANQGNPGRAARCGAPSFCNGCGKSRCPYPLEKSPSRFGFESCGSFPLVFQGKIWGTLNLCVSEPGFFREREVALFKEVAMDISFVLEKIEGNLQRERAQEALRESEERLRLFIEHAPASLAMFDSRMRYLSYSRRWLSDYNLGDRNIVGLSHYEVFPEISEEWKAVHRRALAGAVVRAESDRFERADGSVQWLRWEVRPWRDHRGKISGIVIFTEDITAQRHAEESLTETAWRLELAVASGEMGIWDWDIRTGRMTWEDRMFDLYGLDRELIPASFDTWRNSLHPEDLRSALSAYEKAVCGEEPFDPEFRIVRPDGAVRAIKANAIVLREDAGNATRMIGLNRDITQLKQMESALRERERLFSQIFHQSPQPIVITRQSDGVFIEVNVPFEKVSGYAREEVLGRTATELSLWTNPPDREHVIDLINASGSVYNFETSFRRKSGESFPALFSTTVTEANNESCFISTILDLTDRKRAAEEREKLESQLRHSQKLEAIGTLAGGIAHDFNNILSPIIGYTEMAMDDIPETSSLRYELGQVLTAANRAKELAKQILSFSRLGEDPLMRPLDVSLIVKEALKLLRASLPSSVEIKQAIHRVKAIVDATQIHQVVVNLCTNAAHAMEERGNLAVSLEEVSLRAQDLSLLSLASFMPGRYLKLSVSDTGMGMSDETRFRIFEPYFTTKEVGRGTGLGLAVVHGIVKRHGGEIRVRSELGKGSVFEIFIPVAEEEVKVESAAAKVLPKGTEAILLVDDEPVIASLGARMLEQLGYRVTVQTSSVDALDLFRAKPDDFDLVITDYTMPHRVGTDLAEEILKVRSGVPIILCTGFSEKVSEKEAKDLGIKGFAMKPLARKQLAELVRAVLDGRAV